LIDFPISGLDLTAFVENKSTENIYDLIGVVNHHGVLNRGHYRAAAKSKNG
jgi:ubiquitin C-terminal hydrolase